MTGLPHYKGLEMRQSFFTKRGRCARGERTGAVKHLTDMFACRTSAFRDERTRLRILPSHVKLTRGRVEGAETLLKDLPAQSFLGETADCRMENGEGGERAALLLDFGRETHGTVLVTVSRVQSESTRAKLRIRFGESVMEALSPVGEKNAGNDHAVRDHVYDVGQYGTVQTNESGFRFVYLELESEDTAVHLLSVQHCMIYRDIPYLGSFRCDDELLNTIWKTAAYTVHLNMQDYLWDGIKRDRLAWQGDMHTEVLAIEDVFGGNPVVPKTLDFLRDRTPQGEWINGYSAYTLWWIVVQAEVYRYTGDLAYLREQKDFLVRQLERAASFVDADGSEILPPFRFLDWKNLGDEEATHAGLQSLMVMAVREAIPLLEALGEKEAAGRCAELLQKLCRHVPQPGSSKQAAALLALAGIADAKACNREVIRPGGAAGYSTFMGYYLLAAKAMAGDYAGALDDLRTYWGGMLQMGATSFWEDFDLRWMENAARIDEIPREGQKDIHGDYGMYCYLGYRHSLCHGWSAGPVPYLMRCVAGIRIEEPGCRTIRITPQLGNLKFVEVSYPTPPGILKVRHTEQADGSVRTEYEAPEGMTVIV